MKYISLFFLLLAFSCSKQTIETICDVDNPIEDLPWLKEKVRIAEKKSMPMAFFRSILEEKETKNYIGGILVTWAIGPEIYATIFYNCEGDEICQSDSGGDWNPPSKCEEYTIIEIEKIYESF